MEKTRYAIKLETYYKSDSIFREEVMLTEAELAEVVKTLEEIVSSRAK